ncbi:tyrosine--tRNA ligase, partial [Candidatus Sumerlaeota bacterium]|nr:tyrosine--tRNA ligase [Candidatus Sumerlaeota bacterium]
KPLRRHYGLPQTKVRGVDHAVAYEQLDSGAIDVMDVYTTDAKIKLYDIKVLEDARKFFTRYEAVILVRADLELGGTDQKFNLLVGRDLMHGSGMKGQCVMTMPLIVGLDGKKKMSKSLGNAIGITEEPSEIYGKAMSIPDEMMPEYYRLVLAHAPGEVDKLEKRLGSGELHPRDAKAAMALELVERFHGEAAAKEAQARFDKVHRAHESPDDVEEISLAMKGPRLRLTEAMVRAGMAESKGQAKRLIRQGGVSVDDRRVSSEDMELTEGSYLLKVGRRRFRRIQLTSGGGG